MNRVYLLLLGICVLAAVGFAFVFMQIKMNPPKGSTVHMQNLEQSGAEIDDLVSRMTAPVSPEERGPSLYDQPLFTQLDEIPENTSNNAPIDTPPSAQTKREPEANPYTAVAPTTATAQCFSYLSDDNPQLFQIAKSVVSSMSQSKGTSYYPQSYCYYDDGSVLLSVQPDPLATNPGNTQAVLLFDERWNLLSSTQHMSIKDIGDIVPPVIVSADGFSADLEFTGKNKTSVYYTLDLGSFTYTKVNAPAHSSNQ
jgi:hypothetical protein